MQLVIFPFNSVPTGSMELFSQSVVPNKDASNRKKSESVFRSFLAGRCAAKAALPQNDSSLQVTQNTNYGFLEITSKEGRSPNCYINISHTESLAVAIAAPTPVGIDLEAKSREINTVLERISSPTELSWARKETGREIALWAAKEAASKAIGLGIKAGLKNIELQLPILNSQCGVVIRTEAPMKIQEPLLLFDTFEEYIIAICSDKSTISGGVNRRILFPTDLK